MKLKLPIDDNISFGLWFIAIAEIIYLGTYTNSDLRMLFIVFALLTAGVLTQVAIRGKLPIDVETSREEGRKVFYYTILALAIMVMANIVIPGLFTPPGGPTQASLFDSVAYTSLFAIAEERFFRGSFYLFFVWKLAKPLVAVLATSIVFYFYHFAIYGYAAEKLAFVLMAGFSLGYVTWKSARLSPATLGHIGNNVLAALATLGGI